MMQARQLVGLDVEPDSSAQAAEGFGTAAANGKLRATESSAHNTEYLMNMGYDKAYAEVRLLPQHSTVVKACSL